MQEKNKRANQAELFICLLTYLIHLLICIIWLAPRAGKMIQIARCDWLPSGQGGAILPARDNPLCPARKKFL